MPAPICIIANVHDEGRDADAGDAEGGEEPEREAGEEREDDRDGARHRDVADVHVVGLQREEGQHDRRGVGDGADREIDLGGEDDEGQADGDDAGDRYLLQDVLQVIERRERGAGDAEEQDEEQKRDEGRDIAQLIAGEIGEPERALGGDGNIGLGRVHICSSRQAAASRRSLLIASSANSRAISPLRITSTRSASESTVSGSVENTTMAIP